MMLASRSAFGAHLALTCATLCAIDAHAAPAGIKLSWSSPDASTTMTLSWVTAQTAPTMAEWGVARVGENSLTGAAPRELPGIGWIHEIELTNLRADTVYRYRVGSTGDFSPEYTFRTAPNDQCTPFTFVVLGDARSQDNRGPSPNWSGIQQEAFLAGTRFFLNSGDLVRDGGDIAQWANWITASAMVNPLIPMMPAIGNHDDGPSQGDAANYNRLFALPRNTVTQTEDYYAFVYNNLLVFSLSTQTFEDWTAQTTWMRSVAAMHPNKWKLVYFHHPVYTTQTRLIVDVGHPPNEKGQNSTYGPAFDAAGIDVVMQSHNHIYERFKPLRYSASDPEQGMEVARYGNGAGEGRLYVVSGGSGSFLDPLIEGRFQRRATGSEVRSKDHHFVKISIAGNTLHYSATKTSAGSVSGGGTVIDSLTLTRPGADPCATPGDPDMDGDGYRRSRDCNDADEDINPGAPEVCGNAVDEDCDGMAPMCPGPAVDMDGDGSPAGTDCDDNDRRRFPENPEMACDGVDNDCDCFELCNGVMTDKCARDAGVVPPADAGATPPPDAGSRPNPDASAPDAPGQPSPDATVTPAPDAMVEPAPADSGATAPADSGAAASRPDSGATSEPPTTIAGDGCGCSTTSAPGSSGWLALAALALLAARRRRF